MAKLYFYYSAMNAGKTTTLLQSAYNYYERGMDTLILKPSLDDRHNTDVVRSRIGLETNAVSFNACDDLLELTETRNQKSTLNCLLLDEAQFLTKSQVFELGEIVDKLNIPVLAYGLRTDFKGLLLYFLKDNQSKLNSFLPFTLAGALPIGGSIKIFLTFLKVGAILYSRDRKSVV